MSTTDSHDAVQADRAPRDEPRTMRARTTRRYRVGRRLGAAVVGAVSTTTLIAASPAAAAEPHDLSKQDSYTFTSSSGATLTCGIFATNALSRDGEGALSVHTSGPGECPYAHIAVTVSFIDTTGTPVTFDAAANGGFIGARAHDVASDLEVAYRVTLIGFCDCTSGTFSLPK